MSFYVYQDSKMPYSLTQVLKVQEQHNMCQVSPHDKVRHWSTCLGIGRISLKTILFLISKHSSKEKKMD